MSVLETLAPAQAPGLPAGVDAVAPETADQAAAVLKYATSEGASVLVWGGGEHQGYGEPVFPDIVVSTELLDAVIQWEPDDMTVVVEAGARVSELEARLRTGSQTLLFPEHPGDATVGGVVAAGVSGYRRKRFGPTRDRMLEVGLVTGDGRVITGGGRVVKNVTGYDIPRLVTGAFGSLGLITHVCVKVWPVAQAEATVVVDDPERAAAMTHRPLAILEQPGSVTVFLSGTEAEVAGQAGDLGGDFAEGLAWPRPVAGAVAYEVRVPPDRLGAAIELIDGDPFIAQHGVGTVRAAAGVADAVERLAELRTWAESAGGAVVLTGAPIDVYDALDPWGTPPASLELQRRLIAQFDPARVLNRGKLAGGI